MMWLGSIFGLGGLHRFYLGKPGSGILYLFTWGLFGIGQLVDLVRLNRMVEEANQRHRALYGPRAYPALPAARARLLESGELAASRKALLEEAQRRRGRITVTQGVLATGREFVEVEAMLDNMIKSGFVDIDNDEDSGAVVYVFREMA